MDCFIKLVTEKPLDKSVIRTWFNCVNTFAPSGIINPVTIKDDGETRHVARLVHRTTDDHHVYLIPLTRTLQLAEVDHIVDQFATKEADLDFNIETNETFLRAKDHDTIPLDANKHLALCVAFAKQKHEAWMRERSDAGWRYGVVFDQHEKTHPLLRPWDQLPERYKLPDLDWPQKLVALLNDSGYVVIERDELNKLLALKNKH